MITIYHCRCGRVFSDCYYYESHPSINVKISECDKCMGRHAK